ncbi:MAG: class I SAM-dependent methyltransferase [Nocardioides sp.]|uniref:class I SAM-dependent methyltransferase n=1 Tax=Nocardioides sp. TaxID=35761 RepID=UPI003F058717
MSTHEHQHGEQPGHAHDADRVPAEFWEEFYGGEHPWSGKVNQLLAGELAARPLTTGTALDLGCGTGGDAVWLAAQGWRTTGADIAESALARARAAATEAGVDVTWVRADLETEFPAGTWDLVTASYLHSPTALGRERVLRLAADAVAPGGTLLVVSHQRGPSWKAEGHPGPLPTLEEVVASVHLAGFTLVHAEAHTVACTSPDGVEGTKVDTVVRVRRD